MYTFQDILANIKTTVAIQLAYNSQLISKHHENYLAIRIYFLESDNETATTGVAVAISIVVTLVVTALISVIITSLYYKYKLKEVTKIIKVHNDKNDNKQPVYESVSTIKMDTNPAYGTASTIKMDTNPAYASKP